MAFLGIDKWLGHRRIARTAGRRDNTSRLRVKALEDRNLMSAFQPAGTPFPKIGADTKPSVIFTIGPGGALTTTKTGQGPYDGIEDTYVGVVNRAGSGVIVNSLTVGGASIFGFDGDGIQTFHVPSSYTPPPSAGPNYQVTGYEGPGTFFSKISTDLSTGNVNFDDGSGVGLQPNQETFFSLEELPTAINAGATKVNLTVIGGSPVSAFHPIITYDLVSNTIKTTFAVTNLAGTNFRGDFSLIFSTTTQVFDGTANHHPFTPGSTINPLPVAGSGFTSSGQAYQTFFKFIPAGGTVWVTLSFSAGPLHSGALQAFALPGFSVSLVAGIPA
jgi:hypothetical protein